MKKTANPSDKLKSDVAAVPPLSVNTASSVPERLDILFTPNTSRLIGTGALKVTVSVSSPTAPGARNSGKLLYQDHVLLVVEPGEKTARALPLEEIVYVIAVPGTVPFDVVVLILIVIGAAKTGVVRNTVVAKKRNASKSISN